MPSKCLEMLSKWLQKCPILSDFFTFCPVQANQVGVVTGLGWDFSQAVILETEGIDGDFTGYAEVQKNVTEELVLGRNENPSSKT